MRNILIGYCVVAASCLAIYEQAYANHIQGRKAGFSDTQKYQKTLSPQEVLTFTAGATMSGKNRHNLSTFHAYVMANNVLAWGDTVRQPGRHKQSWYVTPEGYWCESRNLNGSKFSFCYALSVESSLADLAGYTGDFMITIKSVSQRGEDQTARFSNQKYVRTIRRGNPENLPWSGSSDLTWLPAGTPMYSAVSSKPAPVSSSGSASAQGKSMRDKLVEIKKLQEDGLIDEAEAKALRAKVLSN
jgi:hypothetical protein